MLHAVFEKYLLTKLKSSALPVPDHHTLCPQSRRVMICLKCGFFPSGDWTELWATAQIKSVRTFTDQTRYLSRRVRLMQQFEISIIRKLELY